MVTSPESEKDEEEAENEEEKTDNVDEKPKEEASVIAPANGDQSAMEEPAKDDNPAS